jgi:hypothetical protein
MQAELQAAYKKTDQLEGRQAVELLGNYTKMNDSSKKRHPERELRRLMWAWRVLKGRHEKRETAKREIAKEASTKEASTPPRKMNTTPRTPNPIEKLRATSRKGRHEKKESEAREPAKEASTPTRMKMEIAKEAPKKTIKEVLTPSRTMTKLTQQQKSRKPRLSKQVNNSQIREIRANTKRKVSWIETQAARYEHNNHHYFWHRGRPFEAKHYQTQ